MMKLKKLSFLGLSMLWLFMLSQSLSLRAQSAPTRELDFSVLSTENPLSSFEIKSEYKEVLADGTWHSINLNTITKWNAPFANDCFQLSISSFSLGSNPYQNILVSPAVDLSAAAGSQLSMLYAAGSVKGDSPLRVLIINKDGQELAELLSVQPVVGQNLNNFELLRASIPANLSGIGFVAFEGKGDKNNRSSFKLKEIKLAASSNEPSISANPTSLSFDAIAVGEVSVTKQVEFFISNFSDQPTISIVGEHAAEFAFSPAPPVLSASGGAVGVYFAPQSAGEKNASIEVKAGAVSFSVALSATASGGSTPEPSESVELLDDQFFYEFNEGNPVKWEIKGVGTMLTGTQAYNSSTGNALQLDTRSLPNGEHGYVRQMVDLEREGKEVKAGDEIEAMIHYYTDDPISDQLPFRLAYKWLDAQGNVLNTAEESLILNNPELYFGRVKVWGELKVRSIAPEGAKTFAFEIEVHQGAVVRVDDFSMLRLISADRKAFISVVPQWQKLEGEIGNSYTHSFVVQTMHFEEAGQIVLHGEFGVLSMQSTVLATGNKVAKFEYQFNPKKKGIMLPGKPGTPHVECKYRDISSKLLLTTLVIDPANPPTVALQGNEIAPMQAYPNETISKELVFDVSGVIGSVDLALEQEAGGAFRINSTQFFYSQSQDQVLNNKVTLSFNPKNVGNYTARLALRSPMMATKYYELSGECLAPSEVWTETFEADLDLDPRFTGPEWDHFHRFDRGYYKLNGKWLEAHKISIDKDGALSCDEWFENGIRSLSISPASAVASLNVEVSVDGGGHWTKVENPTDGLFMIDNHRPSCFRIRNVGEDAVELSGLSLSKSKAEDRINYERIEDAMQQYNEPALPLIQEDFAMLRHTRGFELESWQNLIFSADRPFFGWDQKNVQTGDIEEHCAQISFFRYQQEDDRKHEAWLVSPALSYEKAASKILTFRLRYELPTENGPEKFGVYIISEDDATLQPQYLDITKLLLVDKFEDGVWYDYYVDLSKLDDITIKDRFYVGFSLYSPVGGNKTSLSFMIDDFSFGRSDLPEVHADQELLHFEFLPDVTTAPIPVNVTVTNPSQALTVHVIPKKLAENFIVSATQLPAAGGQFDVKFHSKKPESMAAALLIQTRGGLSKVVKLLAQKLTSVELTEAAQALQVYPSVAVDQIRVTAPYQQYLIYSTGGVLVQKGEYSERIDVSRLAPARYFIQFILGDDEVQSRSFIRR